MDASIREFVASIKIDKCRLFNTPRLIFLCGGATSKASRASLYSSARDYFFRYVKLSAPEIAQRIRLAEQINDWFDQDTFGDLLESSKPT